MILPYHRLLDGLEESARGGSQIGTTSAALARPMRTRLRAAPGIRLGDLLRPDYLRERLAGTLSQKNLTLTHFGQPALILDELLAQAEGWRVAPPSAAHRRHSAAGSRRGPRRQEILLEGQLGVIRDLDWGTYPFVTSSNPSRAARVSGGLPPPRINRIVGVAKAYCTAVGAGPVSRRSCTMRSAPGCVKWARNTARRPAAAALRLVRRRGDVLRRVAQRLHRPGHHQAGRAGRPAGAENLRRLPAGR